MKGGKDIKVEEKGKNKDQKGGTLANRKEALCGFYTKKPFTSFVLKDVTNPLTW